MALISNCEERPDSPEWDEDENGLRCRRTFLVRCDSIDDGFPVVKTAVGFPLRGSYFQDVPCKSIKVTRQRATGVWIVTADYNLSPTTDEDPNENQNADPLIELPEASSECSNDTKEMEKDLDDKKIQNSAGDPFRNPLEKDVKNRVITISRNVSLATDIAAIDAQYLHSICEEEFWGFEAETARISSINYVNAFKKTATTSYHYLKQTFVIEVRIDKDWQAKVPDVGWRYVSGYESGVGNLHKPFVDEHENPREGFLDGSGGKSTTEEPAILEFKKYEVVSWAGLGLPQSFAECRPYVVR